MEREIVLAVLMLGCFLTTLEAAKLCRKPPPGLVSMTRAVDMTKLDLLPQDTATANGFGRRLIQFTCDEGKTWTSPYEPVDTYDLPDQVETINALPGGVLDASYNVFRDYRNAKTTMSAKLGVSFLRGMFSSSGSYKRMQHTITNSSRIVSTVAAHFSAVQVDFAPYWEQTLINSAQTFVNRRLPDIYASNTSDRFNEFIRRYGTHFFEAGKFGGIFKVNIEIEESLAKRMTENDLEVNAKGSFFSLLKANGAYQGGSTEVTEEYRSKSHITTRYFGGNANLLAASSWTSWWPTVPGNPWLFGGHLEAITNLLDEGPKRQALEKGIEVYLDKAYLNELQRSLSAFMGKGRVGEARARQFYDEATVLLAAEIPDHGSVSALGDRVDEFLIVPDWFAKNTQLCYYWYPDGDAGQCGGSSRTLCAAPDQMTADYRDDTDRRGGGCQMRWGIGTVGAPAWFTEKVSVCYRWHPDGDGGQCGGSAPRETCAPVGGHTAWYRDDTDRRGGGCQMSWRIQVPEDAPGWLLNTKMCFRWYADGDGGQCGGGADNNLCAVANQWTSYYRDDTDRRGGGCQMSWGLMVNNG